MSPNDACAPKAIVCGALRDEVTRLAGDLEVEYLEPKLHDVPEKLRATLAERVLGTAGSRTIVLMYGRCSNGVTGIEAGSHRLVLPAVDDCISLLLGSRDRYLQEFAQNPGTYYYTRGWVEDIDDPYQVYLKMIPKYGEEKARSLAMFELANYTRVALISNGTYDIASCEPYVEKVGAFFGLTVARLEGSLRLIDKALHGPHDGEFIVVEPGSVLDESLFWERDLSPAS
jgi:hypothetical protein